MEEEKANLYLKGISRKEATAKLISLLKDNGNKPITIKSKDGEEAYLSKTSVGKLLSNPAIEKTVNNGFTKEQHFAAVSGIDNLFRDSTKALTHPDRNNDPNIRAMHRFIAPLFGDNVAFITVKEATEQGKKIYAVELIEIGRLEGKLNEVRLRPLASDTATSDPICNIQIFQEKTKNS
jgi:hypothetical protein